MWHEKCVQAEKKGSEWWNEKVGDDQMIIINTIKKGQQARLGESD